MTDNHERLDEFMKARRFELGMRTWRALSEAAGISYETLRAVRAGGNPGDATVNGLESALQWERGSIDAILGGGTPGKPGQPGQPAARPDDEDMTTAELIDKAAELMTEANEYLRRARGESG